MDTYTDRLQVLMVQQQITSYKQLRTLATVSEWSIKQLRQGKIKQMQIITVLKLATALKLSVNELLSLFGGDLDLPVPSETKSDNDCFVQQLEQQKQTFLEQWQRDNLAILESWLRQWPSAVAAVKNNPNLPAKNIIPLLKPVEKLVQSWEVEAIGTVAEVLEYQPQWHQLLEGSADGGDSVIVRYPGYRHRAKLLWRAQVSCLTSDKNKETE